MSNKDRINEFLKYWAKIALQNKDYDFSSDKSADRIYSTLVYTGVPQKDLSVRLDERQVHVNEEGMKEISPSIFEKWQRYYIKNTGIHSFVDPQWSYFCQFISRDQTARNADNHLKVYIPLDSEHIEKGVEMIFDFLTRNNISHVSKVGKKVRFDDVVIRLIKQEDVDNLLAYVKSNPYLQEGLIKANPFAFQKDGIALAVDGKESYNFTMAEMINSYLQDCKLHNKLKKVSYEDFYTFMAEVYNSKFIQKSSYPTKEESKKDKKEILELALKSQLKDFNYDKFIDHYHRAIGLKEELVTTIDPYVERLLLSAIDGMTKRFDNLERGLISVEEYIKTGDSAYLTRNNDLRHKISATSMRQEIIKYLKQNRMSVHKYLIETIKKYNFTPSSNSIKV